MTVPTTAVPNVSYVRTELKDMLPYYTIIRDAIGGSPKVKGNTTKYLPKPNTHLDTPANDRRYKAYLTRAVFYGVTGRTLRGLTGQLFMRDPIVEVPDTMKSVVEDATGEGVSLVQLIKKTANWVVPYGRAGLYVDYPATTGQVTAKQLEDDDIRPTITAYDPAQIINWRTRKRGAVSVLSMVVLEEDYAAIDDGFEIKLDVQWRVLRLTDDDRYTVEIWRKNATKSFTLFQSPMAPLDASGKPFRDIPFCFIGAETNDSEIDPAPMFDLADLNMGHYRNSADHEENLYSSAQSTPVFIGLSEAWADKYFKDGVGIGVGAAIPLPVGGDAKLLQSDQKSALQTEMEHKEAQMVALGAKLVEMKQVQRTATEANQKEASESSTLSSVANNLSLGFQWALGWAAMFIGVPETGIVCNVNNDFSTTKMSSEERAQTVSEWQAEAITFSEMRAALRKTGVATLEDAEATKEIRDAIPMPGSDDDDDDATDDDDDDDKIKVKKK